MGTVTTRTAVDLYYREWGKGRPVVLVHGSPLGSDACDQLADMLASDGYRVITYDRRGSGRSEHPYSGYDEDTYCDDLSDVLMATDATSDVTVIGLSAAAGEVKRYMDRHKGRGVTRALIIEAATIFDDSQMSDDQSIFLKKTHTQSRQSHFAKHMQDLATRLKDILRKGAKVDEFQFNGISIVSQLEPA